MQQGLSMFYVLLISSVFWGMVLDPVVKKCQM